MKLDLESILLSSEPILPFEAGEDNDDLIKNGMNFDISSRIRKLFRFFAPPTKEDTSENQVGNILLTNGTSSSLPPSLHKRKAAEKENSDYKVLTKYRKLDTEFPKVIHSPFEDDTKVVKSQKKSGTTNISSMPAHNNRHQHGNISSPNASGCSGLMNSFDGSIKLKKSPPKLYQIPTRYAEHEFSDDEDLDVPVSVPIRAQSFKKPPPPLIEKKTGGILASSIIPRLEPIRRVLTTSSSSNSSVNKAKEASRSKTWQFLSAHASKPKTWASLLREDKPCTSSRYSTNKKKSILNEDYQNNERVNYLKLLQQYEPSLYKTTNAKTTEKLSTLVSNHKSLSNSSSTTIDLTQSRKIPLLHSRNFSPSVVTLEDDSDVEEVTEIIELDEDDEKLVSVFDKYKSEYIIEPNEVKKAERTLPIVEPVNSLREKINLCPVVKEDDWIANFREKYKQNDLEKQIKDAEEENKRCSQNSTLVERETHEKLKNLHIFDPECIVIDDFSEPEEEEEEPFPELDEEFINDCIGGRSDEVLVSKFNQQIYRRDISTLLGKNWLNDEIINFYMNLLNERGEQRCEEGYPKVYAMNTFFIPRILQSGHSGVKRWTRKVDIFSYDVIPVPVHVGGVHWCMAIIHLKNKTIKYYDSMGTPNNKVLIALESYLKDESLDKKKKPLDTSEFKIENVADCPRQNNGSDCGVFSCMFAEYTCRNKEITFSQDNMEYFRRKMIQEICQGKLLL